MPSQRLSYLLILFLLGACLPVSIWAGDSPSNSPLAGLALDRYTVRHWTASDGLPAGQIQALCQTRDGYLWIGTRNGVARFNGYEFKTLPHVNCICLAEDSDGVVWVGTTFGLYRGVGGPFQKLTTNPMPGKYGPHIFAMCPGKEGGVWVRDSQSLMFVRGTNVSQFVDVNISSYLTDSLRTDGRGRVWIGGRFAPHRWDPEMLKLERCPDLPTALTRIETPMLLRDRHDGLWFGGPTCAVSRNGEVAVFRGRDGTDLWGVRALVEDEFGSIWAICPGGLGIIQGTEIRPPEGLDHRMFKDGICAISNREGGLWIGTTENGLYLVQRKKAAVISQESGLAHNDVWSIAQGQDGSMWIGTSGGLTRLKEGLFTHYGTNEGLLGQQARTVAVDKSGRVWAGTDAQFSKQTGALHLLEGSRFTNLEQSSGFSAGNVRWLTPAVDDSLWIISDAGLTQWKDGNMRSNFEKSVRPWSVFLDQKQTLWLGNNWIGKAEGNRVHWFGIKEGMEQGYYSVAHEDEHGALWVLSSDKGVLRYRDGRFARVSSRQGLFSDLNLCLLDDGFGRYWFNCYKGIYWVRKEELNLVADGKKERITCVAYGVEDGILSLEGNGGNSPNACKAKNGLLWFPTTKGVAIVDPKTTLQDDNAPTVMIEEVRCDGELVKRTMPMLAPHVPEAMEMKLHAGRGRSIVISYGAPSFIAPEKTHYRYRLKGQDKDWVDAQGQPFVQFTSLKPGHYNFQVTACNHRGVWNLNGAELAFAIAPFYYETWTFYGICAVGVLGAAGGIQAYRSSVQRRILVLEREAALAKERERIARDMHDDLGANLTRIARLSELAKVEGGEMPRRLEKISRAAGELVDSIGELVWATNPKYDHLESMVAYFREYTAQHFEGAEIECHVDFPEAVPAASVSADFRRQLFLVLKEALHNVTKHAQATKVWVSLEISGKQLRLEVRDNGKGMDCKESPEFHHGLSNMRERVRSLGGKLEIESELGKGTVVEAEVPLSVRMK
jgi:signal transduction histidine kinase/ligand-binding sensor domain-containing protein